MLFQFEIDDDIIPSLDMYRNTQVHNETHKLTGANVVVPNPGHESNEAMLGSILKNFADQLVEKYPTGERAAKLEESQRLKKEVMDSVKVHTGSELAKRAKKG